MLILLNLAQQSDVDIKKFEELYNNYKNLMFYVSFKILNDKGLAEDVVQQSFIKIIEIFNTLDFNNTNKIRNLFVLISKNISINIYNSNKNKNNIDLEDSHFNNLKDSISHLEYENIENNVEIAIKMLPQTYSDVIYLKYVLGYTNSEISKLLNLTEINVRQRINRGKSKLKEILIEKGVSF